MVKWCDLPIETLELIGTTLLKTSLTDFVRFGAVSKSSHSAYLYARRTSPNYPQIPWIMIPPPVNYENNNENSDAESPSTSASASASLWCFYSLSDNKYYHLEQPPNCGTLNCCGSSQGWLFMMDDQSPTSILTNPISKSQIHLPPFKKLPAILECPPDHNSYLLRFSSKPHENICVPYDKYVSIADTIVEKIVLSSNPTLDPNCIIMLMSRGLNRLAFCKPGGTTWTPVEDKDCQYVDITYWDAHFYAVDSGES